VIVENWKRKVAQMVNTVECSLELSKLGSNSVSINPSCAIFGSLLKKRWVSELWMEPVKSLSSNGVLNSGGSSLIKSTKLLLHKTTDIGINA
jgi:hypothetical protein